MRNYHIFLAALLGLITLGAAPASSPVPATTHAKTLAVHNRSPPLQRVHAASEFRAKADAISRSRSSEGGAAFDRSERYIVHLMPLGLASIPA